MLTGFKAFNLKDEKFYCYEQEYKLGVTVKYEDKEPLELCVKGLHYCAKLSYVFGYYPIDPDVVYGNVSDLGTERLQDDNKTCTNALRLDGLLEGMVEIPGCVWYFKAGRPHRVDGPAMIKYRYMDTVIGAYVAGRSVWYLNGEIQREEYTNGTIVKYYCGKIHCNDGPAIVYSWGTEMWYRNGLLHCEEGPAVRSPDGIVSYYLDGVLMRRGVNVLIRRSDPP